MLQQAKSLDPQLTFMATPWSAPGWMKTSGNMVGGSLTGGDEAVFAQYLTKLVQAYQGQGDADLVPDAWPTSRSTRPAAYPGMLMSASQESTIINDLGPDLDSAGLAAPRSSPGTTTGTTPSLPRAGPGPTGNNTAASPGTTTRATRAPRPPCTTPTRARRRLETEGSWTGGNNWVAEINGQGGATAIDTLRELVADVTFWNLALNASGGPVTGNSCDCTAPVTTNGSGVTYNAEYYILGQFSKFVKPGAVPHRLATCVGNIDNVAFKNPDGTIALVAENTGGSAQTSRSPTAARRSATRCRPAPWRPSPGPARPAAARPRRQARPRRPSGGNGSTGPVTGYQGLCLDVRGASSADGTPVQVYTCNGTNAQSWTVDRRQPAAVARQVPGRGRRRHRQRHLVQLYTCNGTGAQVWQHQSNGELRQPQLRQVPGRHRLRRLRHAGADLVLHRRRQPAVEPAVRPTA